MSGTQVRTETLPDTILSIARDVLATQGLDALSMRSVADKAGVSATAIYHHFDSKQALVEEVVCRGYRRFGSYLEAAIADHPKGSVERLASLGEAYIRFALENQEYFRVIFGIRSHTPRSIAELPGGGGYFVLRQCVVDAMDAGTIRCDAEPDVVVHLLWSVAHGLVTLELACGITDPDAEGCPGEGKGSPIDLFRAFRRLVENGIVADTGRTAAAVEKESQPS
jgi:AcrR family transcriptional regulator